jgi:hypothetical protein
MGDSFICNGDGTWSLNPDERVFCTAPECGWRGKRLDIVNSITDPLTHRSWELCPLCRTPRPYCARLRDARMLEGREIRVLHSRQMLDRVRQVL